jgi:Fe2+ or Zn2+ uptake regulation protein
VTDLPADLLEGVATRIARHHGFILDAGHVALSGVCAECHDA